MTSLRRAAGERVTVQAVPGGRLADGMAVDASITARLLGIRLLKLDAHITFVPATPAVAAPTPAAPPGGGLADAVSLLADAAQTLNQV